MSSEIKKEIEINAILRHANSVQILGFSIDRQRVYIISEFINGCNLNDILFDEYC